MTVLETERLIVRDYLENDLINLHKLLSDKKNMYFLDDISTETIEDSGKNLSEAILNESGHYFCIVNKLTNEFIGSIGYTITADNPPGKTVHLGYFILPEFQRKGYTPEAVKRVLKFAFKEDSCIRVTTACYRENEQSRKVMEKTGFRKEGERIKAQYHDGIMKDRLEYAFNKDDYINLL